MNSNQKSVLIELADKKLLRYVNKQSILENMVIRQEHLSTETKKSQKHKIDQTKLKAEIAEIKSEIEKLQVIINNLSIDGFGLCDNCGTLISFQRLMLNPELKTCSICK